MSAPDRQASLAPPTFDSETRRRNRGVILLLLISGFVVILNETLMGVAIPHLMRDFSVSASAAQWLTTAFLLTVAVVIPMTGLLLQGLPTPTIFVIALSAFSLGTLACGLAPNLALLIAGRVVQAVGTAMVMPMLMTTAIKLVEPHEQGKTMGLISIVIAAAPAVGPTASGIILDTLGWRWMFWLVLPIALIVLLVGARRIHNVTRPRHIPFDLVSVALSVLGFGGVVYALSAFGEAAAEEAAVPAWVPALVGVVALVLFAWRQLVLGRNRRALLDLTPFRTPLFALSSALLVFSMMGMFGVIIIMPIYVQNLVGMNPLHTGLILLPGGLAMGLLAPVIGALYDRFGPTLLVVPGTCLSTLALWAMSGWTADSPLPWILAVHVVFCLGLSAVMTPIYAASLAVLPHELHPYGGAIVGTVQQIGGAAGTALYVAMMSSRMSALAASGTDQTTTITGGVNAAFLGGTIIAVVAIVIALFIRRPVRIAQPAVAPVLH